MNNLTQSQKAAAFDAGMTWIDSQIRILHDKLKSKEWQPSDEIKNEIARYQNIQKRFFDYGDNPHQALNMPPAGLDLSKHVGQTAVLWDGQEFPICKSPNVGITIGGLIYREGGFFKRDKSPHEFNIKTILP